MSISDAVRRARPLLRGGLLMALLPTCQLTVYDSDDATPLFTVSTDPGAANPYLKPFDNYPEQEVDLAAGKTSIGQMTAQILDVPTDPADQDTGWMTAQLSDAAGYSALIGHRVLATEDTGAGPETVLDGVIGHLELLETFSTYQLELSDIRERERQTKAFTVTTTNTLLPRGVLDGYGTSVSVLGLSFKYPIPATVPLLATYRAVDANQGQFSITNLNDSRLVLDDAMRDAIESIAPLEDEPETYVFDKWRIRWRAAGTADPWTLVEQVRHSGSSYAPVPYILRYGKVIAVYANNFVSGDTLPSNGQSVEFVLQYVGPLTEDWPLHLEGYTVGSLLIELYDGVWSDEDPRIRYNAAALDALTTPVRMIVEEPWDDLRKGTQKHLYSIAKASPVLNAAGEIAPISWVMPDSSVTLLQLTNSNCAPEGGGSGHGADDAVNLVRVKYKRDFGVNGVVVDREVTVTHRIQDSIDLIGEKKLEIESDALRALGNKDGLPLFGDITDEVGARVAAEISRMATDRLALGGQRFTIRGRRTDADIEAALPGSWCNCGMTWMPDYNTGERGLSRLAQVVRRRNLNAAWCIFTLIDAGSVNAPLGQPTLGTVTVDADGVPSIPVTALASGDPFARVDYAVSDTEPAAGSSLWTYLDRVDAAPTTLTAPPIPANATVWARARSEGLGERPSTYTTPVSATAGARARVVNVELSIDTSGVVTVMWAPNDDCLGVRLEYEVHDPDVLPAYGSSVDVDASDESYEFTGSPIGDGDVLSIRVIPYTGWTGAAVSGTAGPAVEVRIAGSLDIATVAAAAAQAITDAAGAQATADGKVTTFYQASAPTAEGVGDLWIDTDDGDRLYRWNGSAWVDVQDSDIAQAISDASTAQSTADGKIVTFYQTSAPTAEGVGDLWVDTDDGNRLYRWNGSTWVDIQDADIAQALADAATAITNAAGAQATADGKVTTFVQSSAPTAEGVGDLWIDSDDGNRLYRWSGSAWVDVQDGDIGQAIVDAAGAQATADGKIVSFYQTTTPTAGAVGDIWIDTDDDNHPYRWNGSAWQSMRDGSIATAQTTADGRNTIFRQTTAPTANATGDIWIDTDDDDRRYQWSGAAWVDITATTPAGTFTAGSLRIQVNQGADRLIMTASSGRVVMNFLDTSAVTQASVYLDASDDFNITGSGELILSPVGGVRVGGSGTPVLAVYSATVVWNPGSIAAFAKTTTTVTVTGAQTGDAVFVANEFQADDKALHLFARVTAANTVTLDLHNTYTGGAIDPASRTLRVVVMRF